MLGDTYNVGVDPGAGRFRLPDLMGRFPFGADGAHAVGSQGGAETTTLIDKNLPPHQHLTPTRSSTTTGRSTPSPVGGHSHKLAVANESAASNTVISGGKTKATDTTGPVETAGAHAHRIDVPPLPAGALSTSGAASTGTGSAGPGTSLPFTNMPPWQAVNWIIKT